MLLLDSTPENPSIDQAHELRRLIAKRSSDAKSSASRSAKCRSLTVFSRKGGVGKSVVSLNLGIALARQGATVCLLDAATGVGSLGMLCGQNGYWNLSHVAAGTRGLDEVILHGPDGVRIIPGGDHLLEETLFNSELLRTLRELESRFDWLIVDTGADVLRNTRRFVGAADHAWCVTTPEPTSVAESYCGLKALAAESRSLISVLVNQADDERQATEISNRLRQAARSFLASDISVAGFVPLDDSVRQSVARRESLHAVDSTSAALQAFEQISERLQGSVARANDTRFFERLLARPTTIVSSVAL